VKTAACARIIREVDDMLIGEESESEVEEEQPVQSGNTEGGALPTPVFTPFTGQRVKTFATSEFQSTGNMKSPSEKLEEGLTSVRAQITEELCSSVTKQAEEELQRTYKIESKEELSEEDRAFEGKACW
jgi:hypothetical protein